MTTKAVRATAAYAALTASHEVADFWVQRDAEAVAKGGHGAEGRAACARHVASYTATQALALLAANRVLRLGLDWRRAAAGLAVSAVTHYAADRSGGRWREEGPSTRLVRFARATGHAGWLERDPGAGPLLDQAWHKGWIAVAAVVAGGGR
ncbi:hypothetical protein E6R18_32955 [Streptomyces sp. A1277]|uniref:hypothetical protein n=1 Tax=Streptomyces sp. A1277 TaxID=2563103 RepID=UPI0010A241BD|nr:hypothetical protein [Streptomyces sp. A1277]THA22758.1 hypothetical protein E6R18_32955 [Streptomyces sp. A1277]